MASTQFIELLTLLHETGEKRPLRWEPIKRSRYASRCDFCVALGNGVVHINGNDDDEMSWQARYKAFLMTRDGLLVDELEASQYESEYYPLLRDLFHQARNGAFNLLRMLEEMRADLAAGRTRDLPQELVKPDDDDGIPF